jgi:hypothetical protein
MFFIVVSPFLAVLSDASSPIAEVLNYIPGAPAAGNAKGVQEISREPGFRGELLAPGTEGTLLAEGI